MQVKEADAAAEPGRQKLTARFIWGLSANNGYNRVFETSGNGLYRDTTNTFFNKDFPYAWGPLGASTGWKQTYLTYKDTGAGGFEFYEVPKGTAGALMAYVSVS